MAASKIVLVTRANTGFGLAIVRALCRSGTHYAILLAAGSLSKGEAQVESLKQEFPESRSSVSTVQLDISSDDSSTNTYNTICGRYDRLDVLINNAGIQLTAEDVMKQLKAWNVTLDVNVTGTHVVPETFAPMLLKSPSPRLIFITSGTASLTETMEPNFINKLPPAGWPKDFNRPLLPYRVSKTVLNMVFRDWSKILREDGVKVLAVSPGLLDTGLAGGVFGKIRAVHPSVGAELVKDVAEGKRDNDEGKIVKANGVQPW